jgi:hypothetical protein
MRPFWSGPTMLCAPEGDGGGAGGNSPPAPPPVPKPDDKPAPKPDDKPAPKPDDKPKGDGPLDLLVKDVARVKKHIGLDEDKPAPAPAKKRGGLPVFSIFDKDE